MNRFEAFPISESIKNAVARKLRAKEEIFSFASDPLLASLAFCFGIKHEIGKVSWDRLSPMLGIELDPLQANPWKTEVITSEGRIGIRMWIEGLNEFKPRHTDFALILDPSSIRRNGIEAGRLDQIVIFPSDVAKNYEARGLQLVIVRDWILNSALTSEQKAINYIITNRWEVENNSARLQTKLMSNEQVAFSGTHDLVDHLIGGNASGFALFGKLYAEIAETYVSVFESGKPVSHETLVVSYLIGVLLDDLAQPKWYGSEIHRVILEKALDLLRHHASNAGKTETIEFPESFNRLMATIRSSEACEKVDASPEFSVFALDVG